MTITINAPNAIEPVDHDVPVTTTSLTVTNLTAGRLPIISTGGLFADSANLTYSAVATTGGLTIANSTASTTPTTGALKVGGGAGIAGALNVGNTLDVANVANFASRVGLGEANLTGVHDNVRVTLGGAQTPATAGVIEYGVVNLVDVTGNANQSIYGEMIRPAAIRKAASGTHPAIANLLLSPPVATTGAASVTDTAMLLISGVMGETVSGGNWSIWSQSGISRFDGGIRGNPLGSSDLTVWASNVVPGANNNAALGATGTRWSNVYAVLGTFTTSVTVPKVLYSTTAFTAYNAGNGLQLQTQAGSIYDFVITNPAANAYLMNVPTGTNKVEIPLLGSAGVVTFTNSTASTTISNGALVVSGGVGVNGKVNALYFSSSQTLNQSTVPSVVGSQTASTLQDGSANTGTDTTMSTKYIAFKITASAAHTMGDFEVRVKASGTITNLSSGITAYIYADDGGGTSKPTGSALATGSTIKYGHLTTSYQTLSVGTTYTMVNGTPYWLVLAYDAAPTGANVVFDSAAGANLGATSPDGSTWTNTNIKLYNTINGLTGIGGSFVSTNAAAVNGSSINAAGVTGTSVNGIGMSGYSTNSYGFFATSVNSFGLFVTSTNNTAVYASTGANTAIYGFSSSSGNGIEGYTTSGSGAAGTSSSGAGGTFTSTTGLGITASTNPSSTNTIVSVANFTRSTSGTAAANIAGSVDILVENDGGTAVSTAALVGQLTTVTGGAEVGAAVLTARSGGALTESARFTPALATFPANIQTSGQAARTISMARNTTADTAGLGLTVQAGGATSGATDKGGGVVTIAPGLSTGTGFGSVRIQGLSRAAATGTTDNTLSDRVIIPSRKYLTDNSVVGLFEVALASNTVSGGSIDYAMYATDGTDFQVHTGIFQWCAINKGGVITSASGHASAASGLEVDLSSAGGSITDTFSVAAGSSKITISVNANSSLAGTPTVWMEYVIHNHSAQAITQL